MRDAHSEDARLCACYRRATTQNRCLLFSPARHAATQAIPPERRTDSPEHFFLLFLRAAASVTGVIEYVFMPPAFFCRKHDAVMPDATPPEATHAILMLFLLVVRAIPRRWRRTTFIPTLTLRRAAA